MKRGRLGVLDEECEGQKGRDWIGPQHHKHFSNNMNAKAGHLNQSTTTALKTKIPFPLKCQVSTVVDYSFKNQENLSQ